MQPQTGGEQLNTEGLDVFAEQQEENEMNELSYAFIDAMMSLAAEHWPFYMEDEYRLEVAAITR